MDPSAVIEGKITSISDEITTPTGFKSKNLLIIRPHETNPKWDNYYEIQIRSDRYQLIEKFRVGSHVRATVNLQGNKFARPGKDPIYFKTYQLWKLESLNAATQEFHPEQSGQPEFNEPEEEDLPF